MKTVITPKQKFWHINVKELIHYRDLFYILALRDIKVRYKQTAIGALWAFFVPLITMVVFTTFFGNVPGLHPTTIPYPIFVYIGLVFWNFFSQAISAASGSLVSSQEMIKKIYFPKILLPAAAIFVSFIDFLIAWIILIGMMFYYHYTPNVLAIIVIPLLILVTYVAALGLGLLLAAINVKYRDVRYVLPFFIQTLLFVTPVIYPIDIATSQYRWLLELNPMSGVIELARSMLLQPSSITWNGLVTSVIVSIVLLVVGILYFKKTEEYFADII